MWHTHTYALGEQGRFLELTHTNDLLEVKLVSCIPRVPSAHPLVALLHHRRMMHDALQWCNLETDASNVQATTYCPICCLWRALRPSSLGLPGIYRPYCGCRMLISSLNRLRYILRRRNQTEPKRNESEIEVHVRLPRKLLTN